MIDLKTQIEIKTGKKVQINELFSIQIAKEILPSAKKLVIVSADETVINKMAVTLRAMTEDEVKAFRTAIVKAKLENLFIILNDMTSYIEDFKVVIVSEIVGKYRELFELGFTVNDFTLEQLRELYPEKTDEEREKFKVLAEHLFTKKIEGDNMGAHTIGKGTIISWFYN